MTEKGETAPGQPKGHIHPLSLVMRDMNRIFYDLGFALVSGPEIETEYYNFTALNIPENHPARDMWDTFWLKPLSERKLLRTHTSPVQVRYMEQSEPPFRIIVPGKVFRHEATDATHEAEFFQLEGLAVGKDITLAHLKGTLETFFREFFGSDTSVRLRPSFFPFVEPGVEVDMRCFNCNGGGCSVCKRSGWIEIAGAGMVHPNVLSGAGINPDEWQGFAFGMGVERLAMIRYGIPDIRLFLNGDMRYVNQF